MVEIKESGKTVYMTAKGKLDDADYDKMLPLIKQKIETYGKVNWYFQMKDFKGWTIHAFWRDLKFDLQNATKLGKVAIVGEKKWHEIMTDMMKPFTPADIQYFDADKAEKAKSWVSETES